MSAFEQKGTSGSFTKHKKHFKQEEAFKTTLKKHQKITLKKAFGS